MSVTIAREQLFDLVQKAHAIAPPRGTLQILSNVLFSCDGSDIEVSASDLDQFIVASGRVSGRGNFRVAVNARKIFDVIREMPPGEVSIDEDEKVLSIASERGFSCKVAGADPADFPAEPQIGPTVDVRIPAEDFRRLTDRTAFAVAKDTTRTCLAGILVEVDPKGVRMVGTDGHRLGTCFCALDTGVASKTSVIIGPRSLQHVARITEGGSDEETLTLSLGQKYALISGPGFRLCTKLIEGPYPDYAKVIPTNNPKQAVVERGALLDAVRRVSVLSHQKTRLMKLRFEEGSLEVMVVNREIGAEAREVVPVTYSGDVHTIGFNADYLSEILSVIDTPRVRLDMNTQISACLVLPLDEKSGTPVGDQLFLIMPLRLIDEL